MNNMKNSYFSKLVEHNPKVLAQFSPNNHAIATSAQSQLHIWDTKMKKISHRFECDNVIDFIKWSHDSELICCGLLKDCIQIWNLNLCYWRCKINGCLAFADIKWSSDSRHILVMSEFHIKLTVFSLASSSTVMEIDNPKAIENGILFTPCENYMIVALRINLEDNIGIYNCDTWEPIKVFPVDTKDMTSITFSSRNLMIAILETALEYKVVFYSIDGRLLGKFSVEANFGPTIFNLSPSANILAIGDCSGEVKILDSFSFELLTSYQHPEAVESETINLYKAVERTIMKSPMLGATEFELDEVVKSRPVILCSSTSDSEKIKNKHPMKSGVQTLQFSKNGKYIATIVGYMPKIVFIYNVKSLQLCDVIIRRTNVKCISWHPEKPHLLICSSANMIDIWTPSSCIRHITPFIGDFPVIHAEWSSTENCIILNSRDHFSILYL